MARRSEAPPLTLAELAELVGGRIESGPADREVGAVAELEDAGPRDVAFCADRKRRSPAAGSSAGVLLLPEGLDVEVADETGVIRVEDPYLAIIPVLERLRPLRREEPGVHPSAAMGDGVELGDGVHVGPVAVVGDGARIGAGTEIGPGCVIGPGVVIGRECLLHGRATLYQGTRMGDRVILHAGVVIGADGFGYARDEGVQVKVPQVGGVEIGDDVEIGANACVDRGTFRNTRIGARTKIDNLVQIGHNCVVGANCALSALTGLAGSTVLEDGVVTGGNVGTAGHQTIGAGARIAAKSGVHGDLEPGAVVGGAPQMEIGLWRRVVGVTRQLPELLRRVRRLERAVDKGTRSND